MAAADIQELLLHAEWLRRLASHLVHDGDAADVVQQTWLAALRSPPASDRPARPWLAEVLRNFARRSHRDRLNRGRLEPGSAVERDAAPSPESLLEAAEWQRLLAELVVALEEPYRTTILLRFYQGIEPTEIARTAGVPAGTVRWRVSEGVRRLRAALDARQGGEWRRALLPLAGAGPPATSALKGGLLIMSTKAKLGIAGVFLAVLAASASSWTLRARGTGAPVGEAGIGDRSGESPASLASERAPSAPGTGSGRALALVDKPSAAGERSRPSRLPPPRLLPPEPGTRRASSTAPEQRHGTVDKEEIRRAMRRTIPALKQCYARLLEEQPMASGRLAFHFTITEDGAGGGRVSEASVLPQPAAGVPELVAPLTELCMLEALTEAPFPAPQGGAVTVTYPFSFAPNGDMIPGTARPAPAP